MIGSTRVVRVWARTVPTDLRNGFNGLVGIVSREFKRDPLTGDCFLFVNKRRGSAKVLLWDGTGLAIYAKKLARGRFTSLWNLSDTGAVQMTTLELGLFLEGADLRGKLPLSPSQFVRKVH